MYFREADITRFLLDIYTNEIEMIGVPYLGENSLVGLKYIVSARSRELDLAFGTQVSGLALSNGMNIDAGTTVPREPMASRDTALACLAHLAVQNGLDPAVAAAQRGDPRDDNPLPVSALVGMAGDFQLHAGHSRVDWVGLEAIGFADPILVLLKNTNVVVLTGAKSDGAQLAVWDPLHHDSDLLFVPREQFEQAWSGDVVKVIPRPTSADPPISNGPRTPPEETREEGNEQVSRSARRPLPLARFSIIGAGILAVIGGGLFLYSLPIAEDFTSNAVSASKPSLTPANAAPSKPTSPVAGSNVAAAVPAASGEPMTGEANHFAAALPSEPASNSEISAQQPRLTTPIPAAPTLETLVESDATGATPPPATLPADDRLSPTEIALLLTRGDKSFSSGDVASARLYYGRAANAGDGQAALRLGETFDPFFLDRAHLRSARGDLAAAVSWYRRARDLGAAEADVLLNSLEAKQGDKDP